MATHCILIVRAFNRFFVCRADGSDVEKAPFLAKPVQLTPAWEANNLPNDELNFKGKKLRAMRARASLMRMCKCVCARENCYISVYEESPDGRLKFGHPQTGLVVRALCTRAFSRRTIQTIDAI